MNNTNNTNNRNNKNGLVSRNDYFEFIKLNNSYSDVEKKYFIWYFENIGENYYPSNSNKQINSVVKTVHFSGDLDKITKVDILFQKFTKHNFKFIIKQIKENKLQFDSDILKFIFSHSNSRNQNRFNIVNNVANSISNNIDNTLNDYDNYDNNSDSDTNSDTNSDSDISIQNGGDKKNKKFFKSNTPEKNDWKYMINNIVFRYKKYFTNDTSNLKYLDIGCGNGKKTKLFGNNFQITENNLYGCDITTWGPYESIKNFGFNFSLIQNGKLPYDDSSFDIITAILTLHHIKELDNFIDEITRILKKGGSLIIIEHNIYDDVEAMIIDIQHLFYGAFMDNNLEFVQNEMFTKCYNQMEWNYIFHKHGLQNLHNDMLYPQLENRIRYDNLYYGIFKKL